jgi:hypothetical protein
MNVVLISHTTRREFKSPDSENYYRWELNLNPKAAGFLIGWCKEVLYAKQATETVHLDGQKAKATGVSSGLRLLRTQMNAAYDAKNRHSLPDPLPLDFNAFADAMAAHQIATPAELLESIAKKAADLKDAALTAMIDETVIAAGGDAERLAVIDNRLSVLLLEKREKANV